MRRCARSIEPTSPWVLLAVDGSKEDLPRTRDHEKVFGIADNGVFPQARGTLSVRIFPEEPSPISEHPPGAPHGPAGDAGEAVNAVVFVSATFQYCDAETGFLQRRSLDEKNSA